MDIPDTLQQMMALYRSHSRLFREDNEPFGELSWVQVLEGQRVHVQGGHPFADLRPLDELRAFVANTRTVIGRCIEVMPAHAEFITKHGAAGG